MNQYNKRDTTDLLYLLKKGDKVAFEEIYDRYADKLFRYIHGRVHVKDVSEKIIEEVFLSLWENRKILQEEASLDIYLYSAAKYKILDYIQHSEAKGKYIIDFKLFTAQRNSTYSNALAELPGIHETVEKCISQLPEKCQTIFRMNWREKLSIANIATQLDIPQRTVEDCLLQAMNEVRTSLWH